MDELLNEVVCIHTLAVRLRWSSALSGHSSLISRFLSSLILCCLLPFFSISQVSNAFTNKELIQFSKSSQLSAIDFQISSQYTDFNSGIHHVYVQQYIDNLPLVPVTAGFHFDLQNQLIYSNGNLLTNYQSLISKNNHIIAIEQILNSTLVKKNVQLKNPQFTSDRSRPDAYNYVDYKCPSLVKDEIKARSCYYLNQGNAIVKSYQLIWKRNLENEWLELIVDGSNADILYEHNHLLHCEFDNMVFERKNLFNVLDYSPSPVLANSYRVFSIPTESPIHGSRTLVTAPWLKANNASPLGWHNDGFYSYYTTLGNNVDAFEDSDDDDYPTGGDAARAYGGSQLNFDFPLDPTLPPLQNKNACITNLFYWSNLMHDVWYQYGFNESAGNFQWSNLNKGGLGYDPVISQGIDNILKARNNANFGTPQDGYSGVMQMYVWQPPEKDSIKIESPLSIAGKIMCVHAPISPDVYAPINKQVIQVNDGSSYPSYGCNNFINGSQINGKIALIDRGICSFATKMSKAQSAGAVAVIICNVDDNEPSGFGGWTDGITIPAVNIRKSDCQKIKLQLQNGVFATILPNSTLQFKANQRSYVFSRAAFGGNISNVTAAMVQVIDNANIVTDACDIITNGNALNGKIALVDEGICELSYKAWQAQNYGAIAVVICKQAAGYPDTIPRGSYGQNVHIPVIEISNADGLIVKANLPANGQFINLAQQLTDGDFDAGIICHEYTHGISNRLTGGPANVSCLTNAEQMGEGWSDFFGLVMTIKSSDHAYLNRGIGVYNSGQTISGVGLRPYPYNVSLSVNPADYSQLTDIVNISQPHGIGYIWCSMIWDMNWAMINAYGFEPDIYNANSNKGNIMAYHLVMEGLKLQVCSPGFVDGRNAILKADTILYGGAHTCMIWNVFARRGLGYSANQGSSFSRYDGTPAYNLPPGCSYMSEQQLFLSNQLASYDLVLTANESKDAISLQWTIDKQLEDENWILVRISDQDKNEIVLLNSKTSGKNVHNLIDKNISHGLNYYYQLRVLGSNDKSIHTDWISASLKSSGEQWSCYPNPVNEKLFITTNSSEKKTIELRLYNELLQQIEQTAIDYKPGDRIELDCKSLSNGSYYLLCGSGNTFSCLRFIKN